ncbi:hypothetical protein F5883DRAFT_655131 [Diaporthe sp. PMI_573]|nr:hypothetical protein F5883DRAFT_655131 [Diaporthaceae sp. PMI_573]
MADFPFDPKLPTNNDGHAEVPLPSLDPDPEVRQPSTWAPTSDEERRIFRVWKGFTLAERSKDTLSWLVIRIIKDFTFFKFINLLSKETSEGKAPTNSGREGRHDVLSIGHQKSMGAVIHGYIGV